MCCFGSLFIFYVLCFIKEGYLGEEYLLLFWVIFRVGSRIEYLILLFNVCLYL